MDPSLIILLLILSALIGAVGGLIIGYRRGKVDGSNETVRRLILAKDGECWTAAHYLEADAAANAITERINKRKVV